MANDSITVEWITKPFDDVMKDVRRTTDRATMYALRKTGREMAKIARAKAPVYSGNDPRVTPGDLKKSIKNARQLNHIGTGDYSLKVGPFGSVKKGTAVHYANGKGGALRGVPLYRAAMEAKYGYMAAAMAAAEGLIHEVYEEALAVGYAKYR